MSQILSLYNMEEAILYVFFYLVDIYCTPYWGTYIYEHVLIFFFLPLFSGRGGWSYNFPAAAMVVYVFNNWTIMIL